MGDDELNLYPLSLEIATKAHKGQVDKAGVDYIKHPLKVASMVTSEKEKSLLHFTMY